MENYLAVFEAVCERIREILWGPPMLFVFLAAGVYFTVRTGFFQLTGLKTWLGQTLLAFVKHKEVRKTGENHAISQFQSLCTALAATGGTGNIAGVATAIVAGGPGAVFWMWISAFLGMMTNFAEKTLGIRYRYKDKSGSWVGGAMIYIEKGLHCRWLAVLFSAFCVLASFGIGNMAQANSMAEALYAGMGVPQLATGLVTGVLVCVVIVGGIKRIAGITDKLVPGMTVCYLLGALAVIAFHFQALPEAVGAIFREAFSWKAGLGGAAGYGMRRAMQVGISRGVFSNEAGLGSSVMVHATSDVKEPAVQGMWGICEVFLDTIVVCTITALTILCSGVYNQTIYLNAMASGTLDALANGAALTGQAFSSVFGGAGSIFIAVAMTMFGFSTLLGWSFYGERAVAYLFGEKAVGVYQIVFCCFIVLGCVSRLELVWLVSDIFNGFMAIPNLLALGVLGGQAVAELRGCLMRLEGSD
ncbi:alanine/glycine:cation symporter family protein [Cuneatibacter caecimuris]|uniref:AGCS family alanine or glycine:cation symporter n=1 Tax=Cuneatibacter caecimuris TaxID=1796618 RepID=A0A4Q7PMC7_9FIRM|nr:sodium:alanine symporter family protein [Cuneatibacter caecimuris]RZT02091.1 AGCS family alanine or glycine:cation symporter [Cuneatibacter caecimuris]